LVESKVLERVFSLKRERKEEEDSENLCTEELHNLYSSLYTVKVK
jgi:hypothetical protein